MSTLKLYLFGTPRLERDGEMLAIRRRKGLALLVYLARTGTPHSRESLATLLWPDYDHSSALSNLRREMSRIKSDAELDSDEELFSADRHQLTLEPGLNLYVDTAEFESLMAAATAHEHEPGIVCLDCMERLSRAAELYTSDFLSGFTLPDAPGFDDWQFFEAESLRLLLSQGLQQLFQWHAGQGAYEQAIGYARRWLALDPLHEPAQRELIALYALTGQQSAALRQYEECVRILGEELGVEPEEETTALYEAIRTRQFPPPSGHSGARPLVTTAVPAPPAAAAPPAVPLSAAPLGEVEHQLPTFAGPFVGRAQELAMLGQLFANPELRLITIVGLGGVGKTRLAVAAATAWIKASKEEAAPLPKDGIHFVPLAAVDGPDQLVPAIGNALNLSLRTGEAESQQQLLAFLSGKEYLLILDNFEHLLGDETVALVRAMMAEAPGVRLLLTSRLRLNLQGEQLYPLAGLRVPPAGEVPRREGISDYDALELFRQQAVRIDPDFELVGPNLLAAVQICQLVQGVPLGIELAAGWLELLPATEIAAEVERSIDFLEAGAAEPAEHQQSLRAMFITSWHWLDLKEQEALKGLSVFQGGATREAAQAVTGASLPTLLSLANKSWIQRNETRYQMHELLRQYVRAELKTDPVAWEAACQRHADTYADYLARQAAAMQGSGQREAFAAVRDAFANLRLAWQWLVTHEDVERAVTQMLPGLYRYCEAHLRAYDLLQLLNLVPEPEDVRLQALLATVRSAFYRTGLPVRFETAGSVVPAEEAALRTAWALATQQELFEELGFWGTILAFNYGRVIDRLPGIHHLRRLVAAFERKGETWEQAFALHLLAQLIQGEMDDEETEGYLQRALGLFQKLGDERESGYVLRSLGQQCRLREAFADAIAYWKMAQEKLERAGDVTIGAGIHWQMGDAYLQLGEFEQAFAHYRNMVDAHARMGRKRLVADTLSKASFEAVRYGDFDYARESREQALVLAQDVGDLFNEGWSTWEMGELLRASGNLTSAREWFEKALLLFTRFDDRTGYTFYHRGLGDIALARGNYLEAQLQFQASLRHAQATDNDWGLAYAWCGMGRASVGLEHVEMARQHFLEALHRARATGDRGITLLVLAGISSLFLANGDSERAFELGTFVVTQPLTWRETRTWLQTLLDADDRFPAEERAAAEKRARTRELWPTVQELIDQFEAHVRGRDGRRRPAPAGRLTGREQELADLRRLLLAEKELRVLTITGPPGSGRTHLALATAARIRSAFGDDVLYVPLGGLTGRAEIAEALARHARFPFVPGEDGEEQLLRFLQEQELLLLLDDLAVDEGVDLVEDIIGTAPRLRLLVTATDELGVAGETIYPLRGLAYPADEGITLSDAVHYGAVAFLLDEAEHSVAHFELDSAALPHVVRLVQMVQGQPLALRLLAAQLQHPGPEALSKALARQLARLAEAQPALPMAERPLRAVLAATWQKLAPEMQRALATLSVFEGGFSRQAAEAVAHTSVPVLRALAGSGYLGLDNRGRYTLHEAVRAFGNEQLKALGVEKETHAAHSAYFLTAMRQRVAELQGMVQAESLGEVEADLDNIRAAWAHALAQPDPEGIRRALESLFLFCRLRGLYPEGLALLARARDQLEPVAPEIAGQAHGWFEKLLASAGDKLGTAEGEHRQNLPLQATPFVGRQKELVDLRRLFTAEPDCRLVTVVGPGGIGKTRLAVEAARTALPAFPDGAHFVPLAPLTSPEQIIAAIGESVGLHFASAPAMTEQLFGYLEERELLLVLDNFEHLMAGSSLVAELVLATRAVTILVTSRAALNLSGEMVYTIGGLSYPLDEPGRSIDVTTYASVQLLLQQARLVRPLYRPDANDLRYAARIARLVQGMPLAIVLAAHWLEMLSLEEIAQEIASSLDFLEAETQDVPERQRSVRAVFDYSWRQLPVDAREAFLALSVFRGGFTRHAAQNVTGARLRTLRTLVNKSFLAVTPEGRYEIHELLRQYGEQRLEASGQAGAAREAHGRITCTSFRSVKTI
jgi:predicted ATPase/DNA-binding SARP family transcriptional activator